MNVWPEQETAFQRDFGLADHAALLGLAPHATADVSDAPTDPLGWLREMFPKYVERPFGEHHEEFWDHVWSIELDDAPEAFIAIWGRGGAKSTGAELATTALGCRGKRRYGLYVCSTQDAADKHVGTIGSQLEGAQVERYYPQHADRAVTKFGSSRGWRRNRLVTRGGFVLDAMGLDVAVRGVKFDEQRPDLIVLDDIDDKHDTLMTTEKKIATITTSVLPAGSNNCAVIAVQNLIIPNGVFTRLSDGRADFLADRIVSGPHPVVRDLEWEWEEQEDGSRKPVITAGTPTWLGQDIAQAQGLMRRIGPVAFEKECQHRVKELVEGLVLKEFSDRHMWAAPEPGELHNIIQRERWKLYTGIDFGYWRFAAVLIGVNPAGKVHALDEVFSQKEALSVRAERVRDMLVRWAGGLAVSLVGDAANPTDIFEINKSFRTLGPWRVTSVKAENKARKASVDRLNNLMFTNNFLVRGDIGAGHRWKMGWNASSEGVEVLGSRMLYEFGAWSYPEPRPGEAQKGDPDDNTADGADSIAALRYAVMTALMKGKGEEEPEEPLTNYDRGYKQTLEKLQRTGTRKGRGF